jgi:hypothetical protein
MRTARHAVEIVLLMLLAGGMLLAAIAAARCFIDDEKTQFFVIGYYCAIHNGLVRWIWKKLRIEKALPL